MPVRMMSPDTLDGWTAVSQGLPSSNALATFASGVYFVFISMRPSPLVSPLGRQIFSLSLARFRARSALARLFLHVFAFAPTLIARCCKSPSIKTPSHLNSFDRVLVEEEKGGRADPLKDETQNIKATTRIGKEDRRKERSITTNELTPTTTSNLPTYDQLLFFFSLIIP